MKRERLSLLRVQVFQYCTTIEYYMYTHQYVFIYPATACACSRTELTWQLQQVAQTSTIRSTEQHGALCRWKANYFEVTEGGAFSWCYLQRDQKLRRIYICEQQCVLCNSIFLWVIVRLQPGLCKAQAVIYGPMGLFGPGTLFSFSICARPVKLLGADLSLGRAVDVDHFVRAERGDEGGRAGLSRSRDDGMSEILFGSDVLNALPDFSDGPCALHGDATLCQFNVERICE